MNILQDAKQAFPATNLLDLSENYRLMEFHKRIFQGNPPWKRTKAAGLHAKGMRQRKLLNTAKVVCDEFSAMTFSEQVEITIDDEQFQNYINKTLNAVGFWNKFPELLSYAYAMGGMALKIYAENSKPVVDYVQAEHFLPVGWMGRYRNGLYFSHVLI